MLGLIFCIKTVMKGHCPNSFINFDKKPKGNSGHSLAHNRVYSQTTVTDSQCETCLLWIDKYYIDIPILQSQVKTLTDLVDPLIDENRRLKYII